MLPAGSGKREQVGHQVVCYFHAAATALNYFACNFIKIHRTLHMSPVMPVHVADRLWSVEDLVTPSKAYKQRGAERAA
jgi:hypothetical protein